MSTLFVSGEMHKESALMLSFKFTQEKLGIVYESQPHWKVFVITLDVAA